jgi:hypothetical protein
MPPAVLRGLAAAAFLLALTTAHAQIEVNLSLRRTLYLVYEPLIVTVSIRNLSGAELTLSDTPKNRWFGIIVDTVDGQPIAPNNPNYSNEPVQIAPGQTVRRSVNITPLFPLGEFGTYRIRATVYAQTFNRFFSSPPLGFEITEGRKLWEQDVGVPPGSGAQGQTRLYTLLAHRLPSATMLYLRVQDPERGVIYCTSQLGRFVSFGNPSVLLDRGNGVHILHNMAPREYLYSHFNIDGKVQKQQAYREVTSRPVLVEDGETGVAVLGGTPYDPKATPPERELPGLGERPVPLPTPGGPAPTPKDEKRPRNLLSE